MIAERFPEMVRGAARQSADKANAVQMADAVLCVSNHTKNDLMRYLGMTSERVFVTPLATSINLLSIGDRVNVATPFILYVGQRGGYKNFAALIDAFKRSTLLRTNFCLLCFGGGPFTAEERELLGGCAQSGAGSVMHQTGNDLALAAAYRAASAFVCPSMYEGFGLPLLEAMACGCPSIATPYGSLPEVGADCVAYSVDSSAEALQDVMEKVLFDNEALRVLSLSGMRRASAFSWEETARLTLSAYRKVAA
jgi:glycosyltransferase involved in cell wall biosynthesis